MWDPLFSQARSTVTQTERHREGGNGLPLLPPVGRAWEVEEMPAVARRRLTGDEGGAAQYPWVSAHLVVTLACSTVTRGEPATMTGDPTASNGGSDRVHARGSNAGGGAARPILGQPEVVQP
jgi:hypothetical protein